jgi:hypothetical protein
MNGQGVNGLGKARLLIGLAVIALAAPSGCAAALAVGRGGPVYQVRVATVNGNPTALRGPSAHPACVLQVGNRVAPVWLAQPSLLNHESPVALEADAVALKDGILVERSWNEAVVHHVTEAELTAGAAVVYVPGAGRLTTVELHFDLAPPPRAASSDRQDDLAKNQPALQ